MVDRNRVTTRHFAATETRSCKRMIFETAAAISGVRPGARACKLSESACSDSSQSRKSPTVKCETGANAARSCESQMSLVTSSVSYGIIGSARNAFNGALASFIWARTRSSALTAERPASSSPDLGGDAFASSSRSFMGLALSGLHGEISERVAVQLESQAGFVGQDQAVSIGELGQTLIEHPAHTDSVEMPLAHAAIGDAAMQVHIEVGIAARVVDGNAKRLGH